MGTLALAGCGNGIRDVNAEDSVTTNIDPSGGQIRLMEGVLDLAHGCVDAPTPITFGRYHSVDHVGAVGPVFEVRVPEPSTFQLDPHIGISTSSDVHADPRNVIGFMIPVIGQWVPATTPVGDFTCPPSSVCGTVQRLAYVNPGNLGDAGVTTRTLDLAIVRKCNATEECPSDQACSSGACQACAPGVPCKP
jgi:hypothetical protein